jgi:ABC-type transport system substrate-binding protein
MSKKTKKLEEKRMLSRRDFIKSTAAVTAGVATTSIVGAFSQKSALAQSPSGTINVVAGTDMNNYDMHSTIDGNARQIPFHIFESLVDLDHKPMLATSWENPDQLTWIFHLKKGVEFTNGEPFNASVVKFNLERYMDPKTKAKYRTLLKPVDSVEVLDKETAKIKTKLPFSVLPSVLVRISMMSPKAIKELGKDVVRKPIGTGPYVLKEWVPMERTVLEANRAYYGPKPRLQTIIWRPVPEPSTRIVELQAGKADIINKVPPELVEGISKGGVEVVRRRSLYIQTIKVNCVKPPFNDMRVRQAFNYAVNKEDIIKYVLRGAGYIQTGPLSPDIPGHNPNLKPYPHDPAKAKELLAAAGYPNGVDIEIVSPVGRYFKDKAVVEAISFQVKKAGFNMKVLPMESGMFVKNYKKGHGFFSGSANDDARIQLHKDGDSRGKSFLWHGYHNDEYMRLYDETERTFDVPKRIGMYQRMSELLWNEAICAWLYSSQDIYGVSSRVKDFTPRGDSFIFLHRAYVA